MGAVGRGDVVEFDVTGAITGDGTFCFGFDSLTSDGVAYVAREAVVGGPEMEIIVDGTGPICGDDEVNQPSEECDGIDDDQCGPLFDRALYEGPGNRVLFGDIRCDQHDAPGLFQIAEATAHSGPGERRNEVVRTDRRAEKLLEQVERFIGGLRRADCRDRLRSELLLDLLDLARDEIKRFVPGSFAQLPVLADHRFF